MPTRYYAYYKPCEHCGNEPEPMFIGSVTGIGPGKHRFSWSNKEVKSLEWLKQWLSNKYYILASVEKFQDNYMDETTPEFILNKIETAAEIRELDFVPA